MIAQAINRLFSPRADSGGGTRDPLSNFWYQDIAGTTGDSALTLGTAFACIRVRSNTVAALPWHIYADDNEGVSKIARDHPLYRTIHTKPNVWQSAFKFRQLGQMHIDLRGNFYARWYPATPSHPWPQLVPLSPDRMTVRQLESGRLRYDYRHQTQGLQELSQDDIFHRMGPTFDGVTGVTPLTYARETIGLAVDQQQHARKASKKGGFVKWYLSTTKHMGDTALDNFRERFGEMTNAGEVPIFEDDMKPGTLGMSMVDAQWIESQQFSAVQICQFFDTPLYLVFLPSGNTKGSAEQDQLNYLTMHLNPELCDWEQTLDPWLGEGYFAQFNRDAVVRADMKTRYEAHTMAVGGPFKTPNEARELEDLPPSDSEGADDLRPPPNKSIPAGNTQGQKFNQPAGDDDDDQEAAAPNLRPLIEDAAGRIVSAEVRAVRKHAKLPEFQKWMSRGYAQHSDYIAKVVAPLEAVTGHEVDADGLCVESMNELGNANGDLAELLDNWELTKAGVMADRLEALLCPK